MTSVLNRRFVLRRRCRGIPVAQDFQIDEQPVPTIRDGEFLVRNHYASLDPAMRRRIDDAPSYIPPIALGEPLRTTTLGIVERSRDPAFQPGQWVMGFHAIEEYSVAKADERTWRIDPRNAPAITNYLSVFGPIGLTAYFGLLEVCRPREGDVVLVSGAAGAVGSLVGQIAKIRGCRTIGIAGGAAKCARLRERYGFDAAIDYRGMDLVALSAAIRTEAPDGVDVIFENVGGTILDAGLANMAIGARACLCGLISEYNAAHAVGARELWQLIVKRASLHGFLVADYLPRIAEAQAALRSWLEQGLLVIDEQVEDGIDNAFPAFLKLFDGSNEGKMILKLVP